jgi:hypothetical protein
MNFRSSSLRKKERGDEINKSCGSGTKISSSRACNGSKVRVGVALLKHKEKTLVSVCVSYLCVCVWKSLTGRSTELSSG